MTWRSRWVCRAEAAIDGDADFQMEDGTPRHYR
jgi:hypothetical protein